MAGKGVNKIVLIILAIILPPLAVFLEKGAGKDLVINILLFFLFWIPAIIHALWLITK
ncbi:MAG: proteolipid membrane potential modulator [Deltaproteobacteria bacterium RBG_19FT_COMBO_43_11]|nr:MAG: proteolipid membrane potential modulator [Deltaproteobacteria bacterium RBG_19FT_COMBO_43_11]